MHTVEASWLKTGPAAAFLVRDHSHTHETLLNSGHDSGWFGLIWHQVIQHYFSTILLIPVAVDNLLCGLSDAHRNLLRLPQFLFFVTDFFPPYRKCEPVLRICKFHLIWPSLGLEGVFRKVSFRNFFNQWPFLADLRVFVIKIVLRAERSQKRSPARRDSKNRRKPFDVSVNQFWIAVSSDNGWTVVHIPATCLTISDLALSHFHKFVGLSPSTAIVQSFAPEQI